MSATIAVLNCFFGTWPDWGDLFVESCRYNLTVDFFLIGDCAAPRQGFPPNVHRIELDLAGFNALASQRLGLPIAIDRAYKLIDLRPAWGVIFEHLTREHDFWGYCDLDIIVGDIRAFLTDELLSKHDVVSCRREFLSGHFTLFRNTREINHLYERSRDYQRAFTSADLCNFEECGPGLHPKLLRGARFADVAALSKIESMMHVLARFPEVRVHFETICGEQLGPLLREFEDGDLKILWDRGRVFDLAARRELIYFHLQFLKAQRRIFVPRWSRLPPAFLLTRRGIFQVEDEAWRQRLATECRRTLYFALVRPFVIVPIALKIYFWRRVLRRTAPQARR